MPDPGFQLLYESGPCLAVCKPAGVLTQAPPGIDSLEVRITEYLKQREGKTGNIYLGIPHRLDRPASGAMLFARHVRAARRLAEQFEGRLVDKTYWACVVGHPDPAEGELRDFLRKIPEQPRAEVVPETHPEGRQAILRYRTLGSFDWGAWLEVDLFTGRTHQVRVQLASRGHPLLGDAFYGCDRPFGEPFADVRLRAIALHCRRLAFAHPMAREPVAVEAPLTTAWEALGLGVS